MGNGWRSEAAHEGRVRGKRPFCLFPFVPGFDPGWGVRFSYSSNTGFSTAFFTAMRNCTACFPSTRAVVVGEGQVHHGSNGDLAVPDDGAFLDGACPECRLGAGFRMGVESREPHVPPLDMVATSLQVLHGKGALRAFSASAASSSSSSGAFSGRSPSRRAP